MIKSIKKFLKSILGPRDEIYYVQRSLKHNKNKLQDLEYCEDRDSGVDIEIYKVHSKIERLENWLEVLKKRKNII